MNEHLTTMLSLIFFTALVGFATWLITRRDKRDTSTGFFLAGRSLTFPVIAGSLLLTNLSTEQMVGLNGDAFLYGLCVMAWEVVAVISLVVMAWFFLPRFLRSGITTVPELLEIRFDKRVRLATDVIFLIAYAVILLPMILFTGAKGMIGIMDLKPMLLSILPVSELSDVAVVQIIIWVVALIGAVYALFGGLKSVAVSDTLTGALLLVGGFLITWFGITKLGAQEAVGGGFGEGIKTLQGLGDRFNSIGGPDTNVPFATLFSGVMIINMFYWCTNQQIIQRTLAARSLSEGQKGVLLCGALKLLGPLYLVLPGIIAFAMFKGQNLAPVDAYGKLVHHVLPTYLTGFFAAAMLGAILSSFNSVLNSTCTIFSLGIYKGVFKKGATEAQVLKSGSWFGWIMVVASALVAPQLRHFTSIFGYFQKMNGIYFIPIFAVVIVALLSKYVPAMAALIALLFGVVVISLCYIFGGYFAPADQSYWLRDTINEYHFLAIMFFVLVGFMLIYGKLRPRETAWIQEDAKAVSLVPWKYARIAGVVLLLLVITIYASFADFSVLKKRPAPADLPEGEPMGAPLVVPHDGQ